jgi:hypothetical protein
MHICAGGSGDVRALESSRSLPSGLQRALRLKFSSLRVRKPGIVSQREAAATMSGIASLLQGMLLRYWMKRHDRVYVKLRV